LIWSKLTFRIVDQEIELLGTPICKKHVDFGHETGEGRNVSRVELNCDGASARLLDRGNDLIGGRTIAVISEDLTIGRPMKSIGSSAQFYHPWLAIIYSILKTKELFCVILAV
jgi:hypothetical protein